jgi:hypothetical protein
MEDIRDKEGKKADKREKRFFPEREPTQVLVIYDMLF